MPAIPSSLLGEWAAFERVNGPLLVHERIDYAAALIAAAQRGGEIKDFLIPWDTEDGQSPEEMKAALIQAAGGRVHAGQG